MKYRSLAHLVPAVGLISLSVLTGSALAQDHLFVTDQFRVPVRATPCNTCKIVHYGLLSGTEVQKQGEPEDGWTPIKLLNSSIEGWMENQYLLETPVAREELPELQAQIAATQHDLTLAQSKFDTLLVELENAGLAVKVEETLDDSGAVIAAATRLVSGDLAGVNDRNEELVKRNQVLQQDLDLLVAENERLRDGSSRRWFAYGGFAVILGALLATVLIRMKPKRGYSEWN